MNSCELHALFKLFTLKILNNNRGCKQKKDSYKNLKKNDSINFSIKFELKVRYSQYQSAASLSYMVVLNYLKREQMMRLKLLSMFSVEYLKDQTYCHHYSTMIHLIRYNKVYHNKLDQYFLVMSDLIDLIINLNLRQTEYHHQLHHFHLNQRHQHQLLI